MSITYLPPAIEKVVVDSDDWRPLAARYYFTLSWTDKDGALEHCPGGEDPGTPGCDWAVPHKTLTLTVKAARDLLRQLTEELAEYPTD
jgi:hypothetical protein